MNKSKYVRTRLTNQQLFSHVVKIAKPEYFSDTLPKRSKQGLCKNCELCIAGKYCSKYKTEREGKMLIMMGMNWGINR